MSAHRLITVKLSQTNATDLCTLGRYWLLVMNDFGLPTNTQDLLHIGFIDSSTEKYDSGAPINAAVWH